MEEKEFTFTTWKDIEKDRAEGKLLKCPMHDMCLQDVRRLESFYKISSITFIICSILVLISFISNFI